MDYDENTINSMPTIGPGRDASTTRPQFTDEPSLGSAPTMGPGRDVSTKRPPSLGQIDQYLLVRKLGGGGFGVVYLAHDTVSGVDVALKTLHPLLKSSPEEMEALCAKFALVSRLSHPNIASPLVLHPCRDIVITDHEVHRELRLSPGDSVMVMRYAPGVTLSRWRRQFPDGVVPLDLALAVASQIASALDYAHGEKIVHRDIKPANVMVETLPAEASQPSQVQSSEFKVQSSGGASRPGEPSLVTRHPSLVTSRIRVRILDFGLAAEIRSSMSRISTETGDTSGTRPYMAPEQWLGKKQDGRTDQYALACVLYEMLSGAPPFAGVFETGDPIIMERAVTARSPEELEGVPAHVNAALQKALAKNSKDRFASCTEFVEHCFESQGTQSSQRKGDGSANLRVGRDNVGPGRDGAQPSQASAGSEVDVLRRKRTLTRAVKAISAEDRADGEFSKFAMIAEDELAVAEEACKIGRFVAAVESLNAAETALDELRKTKQSREEAERKAREEADRKEREEAERKAREGVERKAREEAARRAWKEARRKAKEEVREEAELKPREVSEGKGRFRTIAAVLAIVGAVALGVWRIAENGDTASRKEEKPRAEVGNSKSISKTFTVGFDAEFPPYGYKDGNEYKGFDLDLAREVCKRKGWKFVAKPIDWDQKNAELDSGSVDCIWNGFTMQGRENQYAWTPAYVDNSQIVLVAADSKIVRLSDLRGKIVAVMTDTPVQMALQGKDEDNAAAAALGKTLKEIVVAATYNEAIMKLELGAADAAMLDIGIAKQKMAEKVGKFRMLTEIVMVETYGIGFKKGNDALAAEVWKTYKAMLADGTVDKLAAKYKIDGVIR